MTAGQVTRTRTILSERVSWGEWWVGHPSVTSEAARLAVVVVVKIVVMVGGMPCDLCLLAGQSDNDRSIPASDSNWTLSPDKSPRQKESELSRCKRLRRWWSSPEIEGLKGAGLPSAPQRPG
ncbi:hypothetical protein ElyMa_000946000 [Elysia marginata]|uniref:Uncharacterized protein n=1 Tax=Elysia marginata TaxID=1093978 RepID=A0AAV4HBJ4_9GAST|nr:hypothetical protein ElyMa_000946000 [Elysia marginata]